MALSSSTMNALNKLMKITDQLPREENESLNKSSNKGSLGTQKPDKGQQMADYQSKVDSMKTPTPEELANRVSHVLLFSLSY